MSGQGRLSEWPDWPEFTAETGESGDDLTAYKQAIVDKFGQESLTRAWLRTCNELETITDRLSLLGTKAIPEVDFSEICGGHGLSTEKREELKRVGCFKIKAVVAREQAQAWFQDLKDYIEKNRSNIQGWPKETPFILNLYYSPTQISARSHPNTIELSRELNTWWHDPSVSTAEQQSTAEPLSYADGVRIRPPGVPFHGLGPHIDAGSLARWTDPVYQSFYAPIFSGNPEDFDPYDLSKRKDANQAAFKGTAHSTVFRSFQGWTALTPAAPGEGSLMIYPDVKWSMAYVLLRPFFTPPPPSPSSSQRSKDELDASKWEFCCLSGGSGDASWFPGTFQSDSQLLSPSTHPHLRLKECMVSIPAMEPGDTIWWHADVCHAVEVEHRGKGEASVAYIAATPSTENNKKYIRQQLQDFLDGLAPEDFRHNSQDGNSEREFDGFLGEAALLSEEGRRAMGFELSART